MPYELLEFSPHGVLLYFSFLRTSSAVLSVLELLRLLSLLRFLIISYLTKWG